MQRTARKRRLPAPSISTTASKPCLSGLRYNDGMANKFLVTIAAASIAGVSLLAGSPAFAQSYSAPSQDQQIHGRILSFDGAYSLQVRDDAGYTDNVEMHQGTIINPTGLTLAPGMVVSINGYGNGPVFDANEIDTPYTMNAGVAYYNSQPWTYFGAGVALGFFFGNTGWWNGGYYGHPVYVNRGVYVYNHPYVAYNYEHPGYGYNGGWHGGYKRRLARKRVERCSQRRKRVPGNSKAIARTTIRHVRTTCSTRTTPPRRTRNRNARRTFRRRARTAAAASGRPNRCNGTPPRRPPLATTARRSSTTARRPSTTARRPSTTARRWPAA